MARDFYDVITAKVHQVRRVRLPSVGLFASPLSVSYFYGIARNGIYKSRVVDIKQNIQAVVGISHEARFEYMSQSGLYGSYLENSVIEELFNYELGRGVSATQILLDANEQNIPIYTITKDNIDAVLPQLAVSSEVKTDIINAIHAGKHAIVPQREVQHGHWQGSGYIIQDSITGAGAYLLEGGLNGGSLEGLSCEASKDPMATVVQMLMQAIDLYFSMVAMVSMGGFAAAAAASFALRALITSIRVMLKAMIKKKIKKKRAKKRKKKRRTECDCDSKKKKRTRDGKKNPDECEPDIQLEKVEFLNDLDIYKDQVGKAPKITGAQWQDTKIPYGDPEIHERIGYVSGDTLQIKTKFSVEEKPQDLETIFTIIGNAKTSKGKTFLFEYEGATLKGDYVTTKPKSAKKALVKERTQFFNPLTIEWSMKYKKDGISKTKELGSSKHQVYVTFDKPSPNLDKVYLSYLHWATSNPGATTKSEVVQKTWQHFASKNLTAWDGKRKFFYYKTGGLSAGDRPSNCLISSIPYAACGDFADLLIDTLMLNHAEVGSQVIFVSPLQTQDNKMLIKKWKPIPTMPTTVISNVEGYKWKFFLYKGTDGKGSMVSSNGEGASNNEYGDLLNLNGIPGQNTETPAEKVFGYHTIVKLPSNSLPPKLVDMPYFDPSYGMTYRDEKDFENKAIYGYAKETERTDEIIKYEVREKPVPNLLHNIQFEVNMQF